MAYDGKQLLDLVRRRLEAKPRIRLTELAQDCAVCRQTLEKAILAATGKSFCKWRGELLERKARTLLQAGGSLSIKEVSYALGYASPQAFARFMKAACGCSPTELRRRAPQPRR